MSHQTEHENVKTPPMSSENLGSLGSSLCAACGMPAHRYGRNEGMERFDPMACINTLRGEPERKATPAEILAEIHALVDYEAAAIRLAHWDGTDYSDYGRPDEWPHHPDFDDPHLKVDYLDRATAIVDAALEIST